MSNNEMKNAQNTKTRKTEKTWIEKGKEFVKKHKIEIGIGVGLAGLWLYRRNAAKAAKTVNYALEYVPSAPAIPAAPVVETVSEVAEAAAPVVEAVGEVL